MDAKEKVDYVCCIDCGGVEEKSKANWGHNSWNDKKFSNEDHGYVCEKCWDGRGFAVIGFYNINK